MTEVLMFVSGFIFALIGAAILVDYMDIGEDE